jgi:putative hemolysin
MTLTSLPAAGPDPISAAQITLLMVLLALSGLLSGSETALTAMSRWKIRQLRERGEDRSGAFALLESDPTRFITTILIGNNLVNIAATALVTQMSLALALGAGVSEAAAVAAATAVMTVLVLIFGEITPKSFAVHNAEAMSRAVIRPVYALSVLLYPLGRFFTLITASVLRLLRLEPTTSPLISEEELRLMLRSAEEVGVIEAQEQEIMRRVIDLEEKPVREVMTPRVDMIAVAREAPLSEALALISQHGHSRLPVYSESVDDIRGVLYARDLLGYLGRPEAFAEAKVRDLVVPAEQVPENMDAWRLLRLMRMHRNHMAIVVDEFGGTAGLVTLEDLIEELIGEIYDETDIEAEAAIQRLGEGSFRIQGWVHLEHVEATLGLAFEEEAEYHTVAGFLIENLGHIPKAGESVEHGGYRFTVESVAERRVLSVLAELLEPPPQRRPSVPTASA